METKPKRPPGRPRNPDKPQQFSIRLHKPERSALEDMADLFGLSISATVEHFIREAWDSLTPQQRRGMSAIKKARQEAR